MWSFNRRFRFRRQLLLVLGRLLLDRQINSGDRVTHYADGPFRHLAQALMESLQFLQRHNV